MRILRVAPLFWNQSCRTAHMSSRTASDASTSKGTNVNGKTTNGTHSAGPFQVHDGVAPREIARVGVGVIGCGYWGPNLLRNFHSNRDCNLVAVADLNVDRLAWARAQ